MIHSLLVPRPITRLLLVAVGAGFGQLAFTAFDAKFLAYLSGVAAPFCLLCAGAVWSMRDKADALLPADPSSANEIERAHFASQALRHRFMPRAAWVALLALVTGATATSVQFLGFAWQAVVIAGGAAIGESVYSYLVAVSWEDELRSYRARVAAEAARSTASERAVAAIIASAESGSGSALRPWERSSDPLTPSLG